MKVFLQTCVIITYIFFISGCRRDHNNHQDELKKFDLEDALKTKETGNSSEFFDDIKFLVLDGKKEWFFPGHLIEGRYYANHTLFYDIHEKGPIGVFGPDGKLILSLDKKGQGPGEYTGISTFGMNYNEDKVFVVNGYIKKLLWYDLDGNWLETINLPTKCRNLFILPDGNIIIQNLRFESDRLDAHRLILIDPYGSFIKSIWDKPRDLEDYAQYRDPYWLMVSYDGKMYYRDSPKYDTIYSVSDNYNLHTIFLLDVGNNQASHNIATGPNRPDIGRDYLHTERYFVGENKMLVSAYFTSRVYYNIDLNSGDVKCYDRINYDLLGYERFPRDITQDGKYLVQPLYVSSFNKESILKQFGSNEVRFQDIQQQIKDLVINADDDMEVILLYYKLKL